jgi:8-oxo-dGTP diphosphatase
MIHMSYGDSKKFWAIPKPARIPPQTPPAGGTGAEAGRIHIPSQMFRPAESEFLSKKVRANAIITPQMKIIGVAAAIIEDNGKFLIAKRKKGKHLEGKWEFPGGKIEPRETPEKCLARELEEEFGITTEIGSFIGESIFDYGDRKIRLLGYRVRYLSGEFRLSAHDEIRWVPANELNKFDFAEADLPLIEKL